MPLERPEASIPLRSRCGLQHVSSHEMHMTRLRDIVKTGSAPQIRGNFAQIANRLEATSAKVHQCPVDDFQGIAVKKLLLHMARDVRAAAPLYKKDLFAFAWRTRNVFEAMLLLKYVASSGEAARRFIGQKGGDEKAIWDGLIALAEPGDTRVDLLKGRRDHIAAVLGKHGFERASPWRVEQIAEWVEMTSEYAGFYKLYSKYVHPSAWTVLSDQDEYDFESVWEIFLVQGQLHAQHSVRVGDDFNDERARERES